MQATGPTEGTGTSVDLVEYCMSPSVLRVDPGATVTFTNRDNGPHNVVGSGMFVDELRTHESAAFRFDHVGTFAYSCTLHQGMVAAIVVGDGRRTAPANLPILPVEVQTAAETPSPTTSATEPLSSAASASPSAGPVPTAPLVVALVVVAGASYATARRRRRTGSDVTPS